MGHYFLDILYDYFLFKKKSKQVLRVAMQNVKKEGKIAKNIGDMIFCPYPPDFPNCDPL